MVYDSTDSIYIFACCSYLHAFDVFNANEVNALISGDNLDTRFYQKRDSRNFRISLTYNFGNLKLEKENTKIDVEKVKASGGMMK